MHHRVPALALASLLTVACSGGQHPENTEATHAEAVISDASATPGPVAVASDTDATANAASPPADPCDQIAQAEQAFALDSRASEGNAVEHEPFGHCVPAQGASRWAIVRTTLRQIHRDGSEDTDFDSYEGTWAITHIDDHGAKASAIPELGSSEDVHAGAADRANYASVLSDHETTVAPLATADYDGDGSPEAIVLLTNDVHEGATNTGGAVFTFRDGQVVRYAPTNAFTFSAVDDQDHDGRPELLTHGPFSTEGESPGAGFDYLLTGTVFVYHALPDGTFSATDPFAIAALHTACPARPTRLTALADVSCARVWGMSTAAITRMVNRDCRMPASVEARIALDADSCRAQHDVAIAWAALTPPATLGPAAASAAGATPVRGRHGTR